MVSVNFRHFITANQLICIRRKGGEVESHATLNKLENIFRGSTGHLWFRLVYLFEVWEAIAESRYERDL